MYPYTVTYNCPRISVLKQLILNGEGKPPEIFRLAVLSDHESAALVPGGLDRYVCCILPIHCSISIDSADL